jgi:exonuclease VII small subunit
MSVDDEETDAADRRVEEMTYTEASQELDAIVAFFEGREVDVDQLVGRLVRATAIIEELDRRLRRTRMQVDELVPRLTSVLDAADESGGADAAASTGTASSDDEADGERDSEDGAGGVPGVPGLF